MTEANKPRLTVSSLTVRQSAVTIVDQVSFETTPGQLVVLLGPNGAGKSTLLRAMLQLIPCAAGDVRLGNRPIADLPANDRARHLAYLPQHRPLAWPVRVRDVVALGRFAYGAAPEKLSPADQTAVDQALADCRLGALQDRSTRTLSGGELTRVHLARALATRADYLIADEPVAALDPFHQFEVMSVLRRYADAGHGVLAVLHDVDLAVRYADRLVWMADGRLVADGTAAQTLTAETVRTVYGVSADIEAGRVRLSP